MQREETIFSIPAISWMRKPDFIFVSGLCNTNTYNSAVAMSDYIRLSSVMIVRSSAHILFLL